MFPPTAEAWLAAAAVLACIAAVVALLAAARHHNPFGDTVPDMAPPPRYSHRRDADDELHEA